MRTIIAGVSADPQRPASTGHPLRRTSRGGFGVLPEFDDRHPTLEFGRYELLGEIARGATAVVYRARQLGLDRVVALKILQGGPSAGAEQLQRFLQEAQSAASLRHPNIVPIHDFGVQEGLHFFTMDFIAGESLADRLAHGAIPAREALEIARQVAIALHYAHEHNVVHRDIKPGNILLDATGHVWVTDFGVAKQLDHTSMRLTVTGQMIGTPQYMSPEQASGKSAHADRRSDVFSLGLTLYEMLAGRPAFVADAMMQMLQRICRDEPLSPHLINRRVHRDAATICLKALEKDPARRYPTAQAMADDITRFLAGEPIEAQAPSAIRRQLRKLKRFVPLIAGNLLLLGAVAYGIVYYLKSRPSHFALKLGHPDFEVTLDDQPVAPAQLTAPMIIPAGRHRVRVAAEPEYDPQVFEFTTKPAESRSFEVDLERRRGRLVVTADPPDAGITIFGADGFRLPLRGPRVEQELPTGKYTVLVYRENYLAHDLNVVVANRATNTCTVTLPAIGVWSAPTSANIQSVPAVADVDGSGELEAVVGDNAGSVYCVSARTGVMKWVHQVGDAVQAPVALAGTNVFVATTAGKLFCLAGTDGHELWRWPFDAGSAIYGAILVRDLNGDGIPDAIIGAGNGLVAAINGATGTGVWTNNIDGRIESAIALGRIGTNEVVLVGTANEKLYCFDLRRGELLWQVEAGAPLLFPPRFEELAGEPCVLLPTPKSPGDNRTMTAISLTAHKVVGVSDEFPQRFDLTGAGATQAVVVTEAGTTCYAAGSTNPIWQSEYRAVGAYTADMNGDGVLDLVFNNGPDEIVALSGKDGTLLGRIKLDATTGRGFTLDDVLRDGAPAIIVGVAQHLQCFSLNGGRKLWSARSDGYFDAPFRAAGSRFITKDSAGEIACHDSQFSDAIWRVPTSSQPAGYCGVAAGQGVVVDADVSSRLLRVLAADTGKLLWQTQLIAETETIGAPAIGENLVVVSDGVTSVKAFALTNGAPQWSIRLPNITTAPAIGCGRVVVTGMNDRYAAIYCLTATNGAVEWHTGFSDPVPTPPVLMDVNGDGIPDVIAACDNGIVYALDGKDGTTLWMYRHTDRHVHTRNGLIVAGATGFLATSTGELICLDLKTGQPKWTRPLKEPVLGTPALTELDGAPVILVGTMKSRVHCVSGQTGAELWSYEVGASIRYGAPLVVPNPKGGAPLVIVGTGPPENGLYCLRGDGPRAKDRGWTGPWQAAAGAR